MLAGLLVPFFIGLLGGLPIAFSLMIGVIGFVLTQSRLPMDVMAQQMYTAVNSFPLMAIPFFLLSGELMNKTGITGRLVRFINLLVGRIRSGLAQVNIVACMFMAGITGSGVADTAAIGSILIPAMEEEGYGSDYAAALTAAGGVIGPIIPPSIVMVVYASIMPVSVGALFAAGFIPGILLGLGLMVVAYAIGVRRNHPRRETPVPLREYFRGFRDAFWAILMPLIILGGILTGIFTPTEAAAVAVAYALVVGLVIFRSLTWSNILDAVINSAVTSAVILFIVAASNPFGWVMALEQIPQRVATSVLSITTNQTLILLLINLILFIAGMLMETTANILLLAPVLAPLAIKVGVSPLHFAIIMVVNLCIGLATPPVGVNLFVAAPIARTSLERIAQAIIPFLAIETAVLLVITYVPSLTLTIPRFLGLLP